MAVRELSALLRLAAAEAEPALPLPLGAPLRRLSQLAADRDGEVKCAASGALWEAYQFLGLEKALCFDVFFARRSAGGAVFSLHADPWLVQLPAIHQGVSLSWGCLSSKALSRNPP